MEKNDNLIKLIKLKNKLIINLLTFSINKNENNSINLFFYHWIKFIIII